MLFNPPLTTTIITYKLLMFLVVAGHHRCCSCFRWNFRVWCLILNCKNFLCVHASNLCIWSIMICEQQNSFCAKVKLTSSQLHIHSLQWMFEQWKCQAQKPKIFVENKQFNTFFLPLSSHSVVYTENLQIFLLPASEHLPTKNRVKQLLEREREESKNQKATLNANNWV